MVSKELSVEASAVSAAVAEMNDELREIYQAGLKRRVELSHHSVMEKYDLGADFNKVMTNEKKYGANGATTLAKAWDISSAEVYAYRSVYNSWERPEMEKLLKRKTSQGGMIGITHLTVLASITKSALKEQLTNKFFTESLSLRELSAIVQQKLGSRGNNKKGRASLLPRSPVAGLAKFSKQAKAILESQDAFEKAVLERLAKSCEKYADESLANQLTETETDLDALIEMANGNKRKVAAALSNVSKAIQAAEKENGKGKGKGKTAARAVAKKPAGKKSTKAEKPEITDENVYEDELPAAAEESPAATNGHAKSAEAIAKAKALKAKRKKQLQNA